MADSRAAAVFCGSRFGANAQFKGLAERLGQGLTARGWGVIYGGGDVGLMGAVADAVMSAGGHVEGHIPERLMDREVGKRDISDLRITRNMFDRKEAMIDRALAYIALPGGLGTVDEILDVVTLKQLGYHDKPIVLLGADQFWEPLASLFEHIVEQQFASPSAIELATIVEDLDQLWPFLETTQAS